MVVTAPPIPEQGLQLGRWSDVVSVLFAERIDVWELMPEDFVLVTLPQEAPELADYALGLIANPSEKPVIYALVNRKSVTFLLSSGPLQVDLTRGALDVFPR